MVWDVYTMVQLTDRKYIVATSCEVLEGRLKQGGASSDGNGLGLWVLVVWKA